MNHLTYLSVGVVKMMQGFSLILNWFHPDVWQVEHVFCSLSLKTRIQMYSCRRPKPNKRFKNLWEREQVKKDILKTGEGMELLGKGGKMCHSFSDTSWAVFTNQGTSLILLSVWITSYEVHLFVICAIEYTITQKSPKHPNIVVKEWV